MIPPVVTAVVVVAFAALIHNAVDFAVADFVAAADADAVDSFLETAAVAVNVM